MGLNPSLTIAANALRVAEVIAVRMMQARRKEDKEMSKDPTPEIAVVTEASWGIGKALAEVLAGQGVAVAGLSRQAFQPDVDGILPVVADLRDRFPGIVVTDWVLGTHVPRKGIPDGVDPEVAAEWDARLALMSAPEINGMVFLQDQERTMPRSLKAQVKGGLMGRHRSLVGLGQIRLLHNFRADGHAVGGCAAGNSFRRAARLL